MGGGEGGQGPPHSATGKTAINNLHHLSLCAPLDHSTNSSRNLRQKHTRMQPQRAHTRRFTEEMQAAALTHTCTSSYGRMRVATCSHQHTDTPCARLSAKSRVTQIERQRRSPLRPTAAALRRRSGKSASHSPAFCLCGGHVKLMPCMSLLASTQQ